MKLSHKIVDHGIKVTFVNTEFIHAKVTASMVVKSEEKSPIRLVSIPDGLEPGDDRKDVLKLTQSMLKVMPVHLMDLIEKINPRLHGHTIFGVVSASDTCWTPERGRRARFRINQSNDDDQISCVIASIAAGWALEVAEKMGIKRAAVWPAGPGNLAFLLHVPKLIKDGIIDTKGTPIKDNSIWLSKEIPACSSTELPWSFPGDSKQQNIIFEYYASRVNHYVKQCNWLLCNSFHELDSAVSDLIPGIIPIGPLLLGNQLSNYVGSFWPQNSTCLSWLDKQPVGSVIYVAFGSIATFSQKQFDELAHGLELIGQTFLWVVRSDITDGPLAEFLHVFRTRLNDRGMIVEGHLKRRC
uniref:Uncharacterized protein n=1 Tax=Quercus lobata TaxID=97700 RepID=A0A7N2MJJ4_QUELO